MKFNLFLLILTTLIAVALNQSVPPQYQIQLAEDPKYFWAIDDHNKIVLSEHGTWWTIIPYDQGSYIRAVKSGKFVQFTGAGKQLNATKDYEVEFNHRWQFSQGHDDSVIIHSRQNLRTYVTFR